MEIEAEGQTPRKVFLTSEKFATENGTTAYFELPTPKDCNLKRKYLYSKSSQTFYEIKKFENFGSHFQGDFAIQDGSFYTVTPINPIFLALPYLTNSRGLVAEENKGKMCELKEIFNETVGKSTLEKLGLKFLLECPAVRKGLQLICTFTEKDFGDGEQFSFYKLDDQKLEKWLDGRVEKLKASLTAHLPETSYENMKELAERNLNIHALEILHEYMPDAIMLKYLEKYSMNLKNLLEKPQKRKFEGVVNDENQPQETELTASVKKLKLSTAKEEELKKAAKGTKPLALFFSKKS